MARFRFPLQPALAAARARERLRQDALAKANARFDASTLALESVARREGTLRTACRTLVKSVAQPAAAFADVAAFARGLESERRRHLERLVPVRSERIAARAALARETALHAALARLRDRAFAAWKARERRRDENERDEANAHAQARSRSARRYAA